MLGGALVCDDELIAAPVLVAVVREVAADNDGDLPAPVGGETKKKSLYSRSKLSFSTYTALAS